MVLQEFIGKYQRWAHRQAAIIRMCENLMGVKEIDEEINS
jgi:hypothetical protein